MDNVSYTYNMIEIGVSCDNGQFPQHFTTNTKYNAENGDYPIFLQFWPKINFNKEFDPTSNRS